MEEMSLTKFEWNRLNNPTGLKLYLYFRDTNEENTKWEFTKCGKAVGILLAFCRAFNLSLMGGLQCCLSILRNGPYHYFLNVHVDFKMLQRRLSNLR